MGEPEIELDIFDGGIEVLKGFSVLASVESQQDYQNAYSEDGFDVIELDLDSASFLGEQAIEGKLLVKRVYKFIVKLTCLHRVDKETIQQPPVLPGLDNTATADQTWMIRMLKDE